ncbi:hypothetical protein [Alicyclobacillus acidoterrestris]|uniref:Uncharacterized protein n=1 Tax=Alicyclobacillus acidoterrestris (strain ATCC 49025 / DSM 3922 / CIP 106132 / NCIMB 13137 / GD3B) TaxID=1356854 RepID=T0C3X7_ALIAG|nr:hypothetical protein [Alicyclobacillus acidoterrestris]EPZ47709.1 hypothetical protein N007_05495 [Alicyclobacillus acidoterrestris ATCC 49025]UNO47978.1 hypothetical protein K1I37_14990 [Alicyclobacillus acidoterrestris]
MNRILPEDILNAYEVTGLKPSRKGVYDGVYCPPTLAVVYAKYGYNDRRGYVLEHLYGEKYMALSLHYTDGHFDGFYGHECGSIYTEWSSPPTAIPDDYKQGFEDGRAAWGMCMARGLIDDK